MRRKCQHSHNDITLPSFLLFHLPYHHLYVHALLRCVSCRFWVHIKKNLVNTSKLHNCLIRMANQNGAMASAEQPAFYVGSKIPSLLARRALLLVLEQDTCELESCLLCSQ